MLQVKPQLKELLQQHLSQKGVSIRVFAERTGMSYPTVLSLLHKGSVPRKPEHRESVRRELGLDQDAWASVIAASQKDGIDIPEDGPLTLQQLVLKSLLSQGFTEQSFSKLSDIPYPTLMGMTRKGAIPRADTLALLGEKLGLTQEQIDEAVELSRALKRDGDDTADDAIAEVPSSEALSDAPNLAQLVADHIAGSGASIAHYARQHGVPYLSLTKLLNSGVPPRRKSILEPLSRALGLSEQAFETSLIKSKQSPTPASAKRDDVAMTPLQEALHRLVQAKGLTTKAFSELADLSVLTATKLLKHGDLPGRTTTHDKLRNLLQVTPEEYHDLLERSRETGRESEERPAASTAMPYIAPAPAASTGPSVSELAELIERLNPRQREALKSFILTMV